ncbi:MAG: permease-like cell division protein FtsX, partial [Acidobacteriota bacterium]|nr:permease-like cell division protein FtsX [Acidobacteriota bacterium]
MRNIFSITIICLSFLTVGIFLSLSNNLQYVAKQISENMLAVFFLQKDISEPQQKAIEEELNKSPLVIKSRYVDSQMALERFKEKFTELQGIVENLDT